MKTSEIKWLTMLLFTTMLFITACSDDTIRPPYLEEEIEPTPETKEFVVYDAMSYKNKPEHLRPDFPAPCGSTSQR